MENIFRHNKQSLNHQRTFFNKHLIVLDSYKVIRTLYDKGRAKNILKIQNNLLIHM